MAILGRRKSQLYFIFLLTGHFTGCGCSYYQSQYMSQMVVLSSYSLLCVCMRSSEENVTAFTGNGVQHFPKFSDRAHGGMKFDRDSLKYPEH